MEYTTSTRSILVGFIKELADSGDALDTADVGVLGNELNSPFSRDGGFNPI